MAAAAAPAPVTLQWAVGFLGDCKLVGHVGTRTTRFAVVRRVPAFRGQSYALLERALSQWHIDMRLDLTYPPGDQCLMQELLVDVSEELEAECMDRGTAFDNAAWLNNRKALDDFLVAEHAKDLVAELAGYAPIAPVVLPPAPVWEAYGPSDPGGLPPWLTSTGRYRTHYAWEKVAR